MSKKKFPLDPMEFSAEFRRRQNMFKPETRVIVRGYDSQGIWHDGKTVMKVVNFDHDPIQEGSIRIEYNGSKDKAYVHEFQCEKWEEVVLKVAVLDMKIVRATFNRALPNGEYVFKQVFE